MPSLAPKMKSLSILAIYSLKIKFELFPLNYFTWKLEFVSNIFFVISILAQCNEEVAKQNTSFYFIYSLYDWTLYKTNPINNKSKFKYEIQNFSFQLQGYILERCHKMCCRLIFWNGRRLKGSCYQLANRFKKINSSYQSTRNVWDIFVKKQKISIGLYEQVSINLPIISWLKQKIKLVPPLFFELLWTKF